MPPLVATHHPRVCSSNEPESVAASQWCLLYHNYLDVSDIRCIVLLVDLREAASELFLLPATLHKPHPNPSRVLVFH